MGFVLGVIFIPATRRKKQWSWYDEGGLTALFGCFGNTRHCGDAVALPASGAVNDLNSCSNLKDRVSHLIFNDAHS